MRFFVLMIVALMTLPVVAQVESVPQKQKMTALERKMMRSETPRSPAYTKQAYRQAKQLDEAVARHQAKYLEQKKKDEQLSDADIDTEKDRIETMAYINYGLADVDLRAKSAEINENPAQAFYDLSMNAKVRGYGKTVEELQADKAAEAAQLEKERGLTEEEYQAAVADGVGNKSPLGRKSISADLNAL